MPDESFCVKWIIVTVTVWIDQRVIEKGTLQTVTGTKDIEYDGFIHTEWYSLAPGEYHLDEGTARLHAEHLRVEALRKARAEVERLERMEF
jgi:hypothetical protein